MRNFEIERWRHEILAACDIESDPDANKRRKTKRVAAAMSTPPPSNRAHSPAKRIKLCHRKQDASSVDGDDEPVFFSGPLAATAAAVAATADDNNDLDLDQTPRRTTPTQASIRGAPPLPPSYHHSRSSVSSASQITASTSSSTGRRTATSQSRSSSPTKNQKTTQSLLALQKPIHHIPLDDQNKSQLPEDILPLYNRLYDIAVEHEGIAPEEVKEEINSIAVRPFKEACFRKTGGRKKEEALVELSALRRLEKVAWECRRLCRAELAWNFEVHFPLLQLALQRGGGLQGEGEEEDEGSGEEEGYGFRYVRHEVVASAQIAKPFIPRMGLYSESSTVFADKKMVDLAMVLVPPFLDTPFHSSSLPVVQQRHAGTSTSTSTSTGRYKKEKEKANLHRLAHAIHRIVHSQPPDRQSINQTLYTPLCQRPIGISIETKAEGCNKAGRVQLAVWTAAWHERMRDLMIRAGTWSPSTTRLITLPLLLIVGHTCVVSFACDRGEYLEIIGEMTLGETASLKGLYTLVAALRELAGWVQGQFAEWLVAVLELKECSQP